MIPLPQTWLAYEPEEKLAVSSPEILDKYVGVYSSPGAPTKWTITRDGGTLRVQLGNEEAAAVEATADDKFQLFRGIVSFEFDAAKNLLILKRGPVRRVFTKEEYCRRRRDLTEKGDSP